MTMHTVSGFWLSGQVTASICPAEVGEGDRAGGSFEEEESVRQMGELVEGCSKTRTVARVDARVGVGDTYIIR